MQRVVIVDYGSGNLHSANKAVERAAREADLDATVSVTSDAKAVVAADRVILPGVGAFADCKAGLAAVPGMIEALNEDKIALIGIARPLCARPNLPNQLMDGSIDLLPSDEKTLALGPGYLGPKSSNKTIRAINGFANMAFFYRNILRLADGKKPKAKMNLLGAFIKHQQEDAKNAKRLVRG